MLNNETVHELGYNITPAIIVSQLLIIVMVKPIPTLLSLLLQS